MLRSTHAKNTRVAGTPMKRSGTRRGCAARRYAPGAQSVRGVAAGAENQCGFRERCALVLACAALTAVQPDGRAQGPHAGRYFAIHVVDDQTGRGVPLVELKTTHNVRYYTDSAGWIAFYEPGLMDQEVFFHVRSHGYEYPKDGFGYAGVRLRVVEGGRAEIRIRRINIAERLYRITGGGIYRDSVLLGLPVPLEHPVLNGQVFGSDSVLTTVYQSQLFWMWGDTGRPQYPLGNFHMTAATSRLPADGGLDPSIGVNLTYFVGEDGFAKRMAPMKEEGCVWMDGLVTLPAAGGRETMLAAFARVRGLEATLERGFVEWNPQQQVFERVGSFDVNSPVYPGGHPLCATVNGERMLFFARGVPLTRVRADREQYLDVGAYEAFTCLKDHTRVEERQIDRDGQGAVRYAWRRATAPLNCKDQNDLIQSGALKPDEALVQTRDVDSGKPVLVHGGSVYWNDYRSRWVMIALEGWGTSMLGEIWYFEADTPVGPWVYGRKVVTHDSYSFYNPKQHPEFDQQGGRIIYFEGTYSEFVSGVPVPTPWYDYNQIMYRLDLSDARLLLPVPVYAISVDGNMVGPATRTAVAPDATDLPVAFFACDRPGPGLVPVYSVGESASFRLTVGKAAGEPGGVAPAPAFYALPPDSDPKSPTVTGLWEYASTDGRVRQYLTDRDTPPASLVRAEQPLCFVWHSPLSRAMRFSPHSVKPCRSAVK
jgi:hypothetical protein